MRILFISLKNSSLSTGVSLFISMYNECSKVGKHVLKTDELELTMPLLNMSVSEIEEVVTNETLEFLSELKNSCVTQEDILLLVLHD